MAFGMEGAPQMHWSKENLRLAGEKLQEKAPVFGDEGDTGEREGKYYAMGFEVEKEEYGHFIDQLSVLLDLKKEFLDEELNKAA